ncbi:MAG: NUDIX hydrolase [Proteobacteria bacterium]|nr:MAG: NUDIX hydrolase [Pseudomonadota bacterium]
MSDAVPIRPAATVVLLREGCAAPEVLLLRRSSKLAFHGGAWVFPGGRVDLDAGESDDDAGARRAAAREAREEAGLEIDAASLVQISHWTTPEGQPRRFATWFYVAEIGRAEVRVDGGEISDHRWVTPDAALAAQRAGEIELPPPTFVTLAELARHRSPRDALAAAASAHPIVYVPRIVTAAGGATSLYPGDAGWEARAPDTPGARHRLLFLASGWRYLREI